MRRRATAYAGIVEAIAATALLGCGSAPATTPTPAPNCNEFSWAFESRGSDSLRLPAASKLLTVASLRLRPGQLPTDAGLCDDHATNLTWESSDPVVASVTPFGTRTASVIALIPGTTIITARFLVDGAVKSIATTITVLPALTPAVFEFNAR